MKVLVDYIEKKGGNEFRPFMQTATFLIDRIGMEFTYLSLQKFLHIVVVTGTKLALYHCNLTYNQLFCNELQNS